MLVNGEKDILGPIASHGIAITQFGHNKLFWMLGHA